MAGDDGKEDKSPFDLEDPHPMMIVRVRVCAAVHSLAVDYSVVLVDAALYQLPGATSSVVLVSCDPQPCLSIFCKKILL